MATQSATQINFNDGRLSIDGFPVECWRIAAGAAPADTCVITPSRFDLVKAVFGPVGSNLSTTPSTNVTVTLPAMGATNATIPAVDVWIVGYLQN